MHKQTKNLATFYDSQAEKFSGTRKRHWPEFDIILAAVKACIGRKSTIRILEVGCGDGRLLGFLQTHLTQTIVYTGVDISYNLLKIANDDYPDARWVHKDMVSFLMNAKPEEYDVIIGVASFHHLPTQQLRSLALDSMYACLAYEGACIMTNRCYSDWFRQKYRREIRLASWKSIATLGYKDKNDIMVPWKENDGKIVSTRLYHIFSQKELSRLFLGSGFSHIKHVYVDNTGKETSAEQEGRNLITVGRKTIYQE